VSGATASVSCGNLYATGAISIGSIGSIGGEDCKVAADQLADFVIEEDGFGFIAECGPSIVDMLAVDGDQTFQATDCADYFVYNMDATSQTLDAMDVDNFTIEGFDSTQDKLIFINADASTRYNWQEGRGHIESDTRYWDHNGYRSRYNIYAEIELSGVSSFSVLDRTSVNGRYTTSRDVIHLFSESGTTLEIDALAYPESETSPEDLSSSVLVYMGDVASSFNDAAETET